uniref:Uncharacterized protein n=1 Tax=Panagrolaimus superbus TaxID=310955 RepID=A0A914Y6K3_9BILA
MSPNDLITNQSSIISETMPEEIRLFARTVDCLLSTSVKHPQLLELYLKDENPSLLNISLEVVKYISWTERIKFLTILLTKYQISKDEISILCYICVCKFEFPWLPESYRTKMKDLQKMAFKKIEKEKIDRNRLLDLINLSGTLL